ncbi:MAG: YceI family protein [Actinomycetota bacterium]
MDETITKAAEGAGAPPTGAWKIDPGHTNVGFVARHLMLTKVRGRFTEVEGAITIGETADASSVEVRVKADSIDTGNDGRDEHLRSADFLDVDTFSELVFRSTKVEITGDTTLKVTGDLTIRDTTRPLVLDVEYEGVGPDPWGGTRVSFTAKTEIDREEWGITWNAALESGGVLVSKKVQIELDIQAVLQKVDEQVA